MSVSSESMACRKTLSSRPAAGSTLRGTPRSTTSSGRAARRRSASARRSAVRIGSRRRGGGDHHVGGDDGAGQVVERRQLDRRQLAAERLGAGRRAVGDPHLGGTPLEQVAGHLLGGLAGADDQHPCAVEAAEDVAGQLDDGVAERHRAGGDPGLRARPPAGGDGGLEQSPQHRAGRPHVLGQRRRLLDLAEDLRLAEHHRSEAAGHRQQVARRLAVALDVEPPVLGRLRRPLDEDAGEAGAVGLFVVARHQVEFGAVAGRQQAGLGHLLARQQVDQRLLGVGRRVAQPLAHLDRRGAEVGADQQKRWVADDGGSRPTATRRAIRRSHGSPRTGR